jgi:hypothetical protein
MCPIGGKPCAETVQNRPDRTLRTAVPLFAHRAPELQSLVAALVPALAEVVGVRREGTLSLTTRFTFRKALGRIPAFDSASTDAEFAGHRPDRPALAFEHLKPLVAVDA